MFNCRNDGIDVLFDLSDLEPQEVHAETLQMQLSFPILGLAAYVIASVNLDGEKKLVAEEVDDVLP